MDRSIAVRLPINRSTWYDIWGLILFILWSIFICIFKINICDIFDKIHFFMLWLHSETSVFRMYFIFVSMKNPNSAMPITTLKIRRLYDSLTFLKWNSYTVTTASFGQLWVVLSHGQGSAETYIHTYIQAYIFVVVNFDALAQASDIQIERKQVVFLCWMQDLNPGSQTPNRQQTECSLTNRLSYRGSS